jgi:hypothetical protein
MKKPAQVVMLPTNEKAKIGDIVMSKFDDIHILTKNDGKEYAKTVTSQHLYFLSNEEIKEGDWFIMNSCIVRQCSLHKGDILDTIGGLHHESVCKKIIATTDRSLGLVVDQNGCLMQAYSKFLPQIPQSFIEYFVAEYNKGNVITDVMVEYDCDHNQMPERVIDVLKINPDNTINISMPKDDWSREEVIELLKKYSKECTGWFWTETDEKWIEEKL